MPDNMVSTITFNEKKYQSFIKRIEKAASGFKKASKKLQSLGIIIKYNCDTTELDKKIEDIINKSIVIKMKKRA